MCDIRAICLLFSFTLHEEKDMLNKRYLIMIGIVAVLAMILVACAPATPTEAPAEQPSGGGEAMGCPDGWGTDFTAELESACNGELDGTVVTMTGPFVDADEVKFNDSVAEFEDLTGIDIQYSGTKEFETIIATSVEGGNAPDIADFPQPGLLARMVAGGYVVDLTDTLNQDWLQTNYKQAWLDMAMQPDADGNLIMAGVWARFNAKSQVWYPKDDFDAAGYQIPETWDELVALQDQIVADGGTPWCIGIGSGAATGWPATDWMEDFMLRTTSLENYDRWSFPIGDMERLPFTSPEVKAAAERMSEIWFNDDYVYGGTASIATTDFDVAPLPMFDDPPGCYLHKQGNFITSFFPEDTVAGVDYDFFYLPPIDEQYGKPYLIAGDIYAMFNNRPEVVAVMDYFSRGASLKAWMAGGGALSPHNDAPLDWYGDDIERGIAELVQQADSVRFDGSDLMPAAVGQGSFWEGMTAYVSGEVDLDTALQEIDAAWPE
jgi:alpha-glucoside transport system substrate-binding protein